MSKAVVELPIGGIKMARSGLARQLLTDSGRSAAFSGAHIDGQSFENDGKAVLFVRNESANPVDVTIRSTYTRNGLKLADRTITVEAGASTFVGPFDPPTYNQPVEEGDTYGRVWVDYNSIDGVSVAVLEIPPLAR